MIKLMILSENSVGHADGLLAEHGFAMMIEKDGQRFLFDTGQGRVLLNNSTKLGISLKDLDGVILSHGHWDHAGGLHEVLLLNPRGVRVYAHPDVFVERYYTEVSDNGSESLRFAGIRYPKPQLESFGAEFVSNREMMEIMPGMILTGEIPRETSFERTAQQLRIRSGSEIVPDAVLDEQSLVMHTDRGLIIVTGCAHPGIINIINHACRITGIREIEAVIGGTHLMFQGDQQLSETVEALKGYSLRLIGTTHCTGSKAASIIRHAFPNQFMVCNVGTKITFQ